jgi:hypothetical protein
MTKEQWIWSERRPGGGGRRENGARAAPAAIGRDPLMENRTELHQIEEPAAPKRETLHLTGIRSHGPADPRPIGPPWPAQIDWRESLRRAKKIGV